jgi:hypothetical protein
LLVFPVAVTLSQKEADLTVTVEHYSFAAFTILILFVPTIRHNIYRSSISSSSDCFSVLASKIFILRNRLLDLPLPSRAGIIALDRGTSTGPSIVTARIHAALVQIGRTIAPRWVSSDKQGNSNGPSNGIRSPGTRNKSAESEWLNLAGPFNNNEYCYSRH